MVSTSVFADLASAWFLPAVFADVKVVLVKRPPVDALAAAYFSAFETALPHERKDLDGAEAAYRAAIQTDPGHARAQLNLAVLVKQKDELLKKNGLWNLDVQAENRAVEAAAAAHGL